MSAPTATGDLLARICAEIDARIAQLRPAIDEHERLLETAATLELEIAAAAAAGQAPDAPAGGRGGRRGPGAVARAASPPRKGRAPAGRAPSKRSAAQQAIAAALEHGSHTVAELVVVTALPGGDIREGLRGLQRAGAVTRSRREGRIAYVLSDRA